MNYFDLFELPLSLKVDKAYNLRTFYALSRAHHPDQFTLSSADEQEQALQMSTQINTAKKTLDDRHLRLDYVLRLKQILNDDEKFSLPPAFLSDMMDINEQIMDLNMEPNEALQTSILSQLQSLEESLYQPLARFFEADVLQASEEELQQLKVYYYKMKYLHRIRENLAGREPEL